MFGEGSPADVVERAGRGQLEIQDEEYWQLSGICTIHKGQVGLRLRDGARLSL